MAADFGDTADRLTAGTYTPPAQGTVSLWWYPTFTIADGVSHFAFSVRNAASSNYWDFAKNTGNQLVFVAGGEATFAVTPTGFTQNQWNHCIVTWDDSANTREIFVGGTSLGSSALAFSLSGLAETLHIGNIRSDVLSADARGRMAEFAVWDAVLSAGEINALAVGVAPAFIRRASLAMYFPLQNTTFREIVSGVTVSNTSVTVADHPPIIYPSSRKVT